MANFKLLIVLFGIFCFGILETLQMDVDDDLILTYKEKLKLDEFKRLVSSRLPHAYMTQEIYLVRFLRAKKFNIRAAERLIMDNVKWREQNRMDTILQEDWSDFHRDYKYEIQGCDLKGRPIVTVHVGEWPVRKAVVSGKSQRMMRYMDKYFEELSVYIRQAQQNGQNVSQYSELYDMSGYTLMETGCPLCIPLYVHLFQTFEAHYPGNSHRTWLVKTPTYFQTLFQILHPIMSERTRKTLKVFGRNSKEWEKEVYEQVDKSQLTHEFGGTKEGPMDMEAIRNQVNGTFDCST